MARNGSGTYSNPYPNFVSGTVISSSEVDANNSDIATALTQSIAVDGQSTVTSNIPLSTNKLTGVGAGSAATDSLNLGQAQAEAFIWCGTAGGSADAITLSPSPAITAYAAGQRFVWMASSSANTGATTVAISGLTAIALQDNGAALVAGNHAANKMFMGILNTTSTVQIMQVQVSGTDPLIVSSLTLNSDAAVLGFGVNTDVTLTHVHDTGLLLNGAMQLQFSDSSQFINAPSATVLDINATDEIELNATLVDVNANLDVSGTALITGVATHGDDVVSDTDSTDDLGTTGVRWANLFVDAITATDQVTATGFTGTLDGILGSGTPAAATVTTIDASGVATAATFEPDGDTSASDNAAIGYTAAEGLILTGQGSTSDVTIKNDADSPVLTIATGTTSVDIVGSLTASTLNPDSDTSAGAAAQLGYTAVSGLILTGQGSTNDVTIRNDTNSAVLEIATGQSDVEISAGNLFFGTASKGVYLGVTSATAANLLDDYEEGTWTAALEGSSGNPTSAVNTTGTYTKIGRLVYVTASYVGVTTTGASGGIRITGLPFTPSATQATGNVALHTIGSFTNTNITPYFTTTPYVAFYTSPTAAAWAEVMHNAGASRYLYFSGTYTV